MISGDELEFIKKDSWHSKLFRDERVGRALRVLDKWP